MGKPSNSCFKILTCGASDEDDQEIAAADAEKIPSSDKRRWSFRKKSSGQRVVSNSVISEPHSVNSNKEIQEATATNCYSPIHSSIPEKTYIQEPEKTYIQQHVETQQQESLNETHPTFEDAVSADIVIQDKNDTATDEELSESVAVIIQAAVRKYTAQAELQKLKHLVKLQAAVRGHLVRRQAVGTLRCIHAIIKMQMLVRARYALKSAKFLSNSGNGEQHASTYQKETPSTQKLLSNGFARQLLESTSKAKPIHIKCDPSKSDSTWLWLERWMVVSSDDIQPVQDEASLEQVEEVRQSTHEAPDDTSEQVASVPSATNTVQTESPGTPEGEGDLAPKSLGAYDMEVSLENNDVDQSLPSNISGMKECKSENFLEGSTDFLPVQILPESDLSSESVVDSSAEKPECGRIPKNSDRTVTREPSATEGKKVSVASRKASNPAFVAAQSKFEELSSTQYAGKSTKPIYRDALNGTKVDDLLKRADSSSKTDDLKVNLPSNSHDPSLGDSHDPQVQVAISECGTEISISSTLDSPDRSEAEAGEIVLEIGSLEKEKYDNGHANISINHENVTPETKDESLEPEVPMEKVEHSNETISSPVVTSDLVQEALDRTTDPPVHMEKQNDPQVYRSSPDASPRSHMTVPESHGTPSSQISVKGKQSKKENVAPARKQKSQLVVKRSPSNSNADSGGRSNTKHQDAKSTKKRDSFGITKQDQVDHEPRTSSSSALPSYMQATESARAKLHASVSPKASPDVNDKDNYPKKRHSLPIANGKPGSSPRMQRSSSQAQENLKGNGIHSPQTSAERRWQR